LTRNEPVLSRRLCLCFQFQVLPGPVASSDRVERVLPPEGWFFFAPPLVVVVVVVVVAVFLGAAACKRRRDGARDFLLLDCPRSAFHRSRSSPPPARTCSCVSSQECTLSEMVGDVDDGLRRAGAAAGGGQRVAARVKKEESETSGGAERRGLQGRGAGAADKASPGQSGKAANLKPCRVWEVEGKRVSLSLGEGSPNRGWGQRRLYIRLKVALLGVLPLDLLFPIVRRVFTIGTHHEPPFGKYLGF